MAAIKKAPLCNDAALSETIMQTGESAKFILTIVNWQSCFIASKIKEGGLDSVRIYKFGEFRPKLKRIANRGMGTRIVSTQRVAGGETREVRS